MPWTSAVWAAVSIEITPVSPETSSPGASVAARGRKRLEVFFASRTVCPAGTASYDAVRRATAASMSDPSDEHSTARYSARSRNGEGVRLTPGPGGSDRPGRARRRGGRPPRCRRARAPPAGRARRRPPSRTAASRPWAPEETAIATQTSSAVSVEAVEARPTPRRTCGRRGRARLPPRARGCGPSWRGPASPASGPRRRGRSCPAR